MEKMKLFTIYDYYGGSIDIYFEPEKIRNCSFVVNHKKDSEATFHPATITYTGVTVGGIHTGGFNVTKEYYSYKSTMTGYGELEFCDYDGEKHNVRSIKFSPEIEKIAEKALSDFKNPYYLYVQKNSFSENEFVSAMSTNNGYAKADIVNRMNKNHASAYKCEELGVFLLRVIRGEFLDTEQKTEAVNKLLSSGNELDLLNATDILINPANETEKQLADLVNSKIQNASIYKIGDKVFTNKKDYNSLLVRKIIELISAVALGLGAILWFGACFMKNGGAVGKAGLASFLIGVVILVILMIIDEFKK